MGIENNENEIATEDNDDKNEIIKKLKEENEFLRIKRWRKKNGVNKNKLKPLESININQNSGKWL